MIVILAAALVWGLTEGAEAADRDIYGNWVIGGTIRIVGETIDVRGNVTIASGGTLQLVDCDLAINGSANGQRSLLVRTGGKLEAQDSTIRGSDARITIKFESDATIDRCTISHFYGSGTNRGMMLAGGTITITDTVIEDSNYYGLILETDTVLTNVTVRDITYSNVYISNYYADAAYTVSIDECRFEGSGGTSQLISGIYVICYSTGEQVDIQVDDTSFHNLYRGIYTYTTGKVTMNVERCVFTRCRYGLFSYSTGGTFTLQDNWVTNGTGSSSVGFSIRTGPSITNNLAGNRVTDVGTAYHFSGPFTGAYTTSVGHLTVQDCVYGIRADRSLTLTVHNSSLTGIKDVYGCFWATNSSSITVYDTVHMKGSGTVDSNSWIKAYTEVEILGAKWKDAQAIAEGFLVLENATQVEVVRFNLSMLKRERVAGWEIDSNGRRTSTYLYPAIYIQGHGFRGERIDIWYPAPRRVELVDDYVPTLSISTPSPDGGYSSTTVMASGTYHELGAGVDRVEYSMDGETYSPLTSWSDGTWSLPMLSLSDGEHTLYLRIYDVVGLGGDVVSVSFLVDTVIPFIDMDPTQELVNNESYAISGRTEGMTILTVNGVEWPVSEAGTFSALVTLEEGPNTIVVNVIDRAGHENSVSISVTLDTIAPPLLITAPEDDIWTNARSVYVEGTTEDGVDLVVIDSTASVVEGGFRKRVDLAEGEFVITVDATDLAGNSATAEVTLHVDWTAPELTISDPKNAEVYIRDSTFYISGDVDDPTLDHVMIDDVFVKLTNGGFDEQFTIPEGTRVFIINATDAAGNSVTTKVVIIRDLTPPTYVTELTALGGELLYIEGSLYCTAPIVEVHLTIDEVSIVAPSGGEALSPSTDVRLQFDMVEGSNEIEIYITDAAGNQAQTYRQRIYVDTTSPTLTMTSPQPGARTKEDTASINGITEEGSSLTINGESVALLSGGKFQHTVALVDGRNEFTLEVVDAMGNTNTTSVSVLRESDVQPSEVSSTGAAFGGFLAGLVVGVILAAVFFVMRGKREQQDREAPQPRKEDRPAPAEPRDGYQVPPPPPRTPPPQTPPPPTQTPPAEEPGGWEEY